MSYEFPAIPTDLWQKWQAEIFKKDSQESQDNIFGGFAFRQAADEEIAAIPPVWPNPSDLVAPPTPEATATPSPEAVSPTPLSAPYDSSGSLTPVETDPNAFNPTPQSPHETSPSFLPSPTFAPTSVGTPTSMGTTPGQKAGSFLDSANAAIQDTFNQAKYLISPDYGTPTYGPTEPTIGPPEKGDVTDPITYIRNWINTLPSAESGGAIRGGLAAGQIGDLANHLYTAARQLAEKVPGLQSVDRSLRGPGGFTPLDYVEGTANLLGPDPAAGLAHGLLGGGALAAGIASHGDEAAKAAKLAAENSAEALKAIEQGIHPLQGFLDNLVTRVETIPEDVRGNLKYPTAAATARKTIADMKDKGLDVSEAEAAMEDFHMISRSDYERGADGADEFHGNKRDAWDTFVESIQDYDLESSHPTDIPDTVSQVATQNMVGDTVRVYRGEGTLPPGSGGYGPEESGRWFTINPTIAEDYASAAVVDGNPLPVLYVDLPRDVAESLIRRSNTSPQHQFDARSGTEFILPDEWLNKAKSIDDALLNSGASSVVDTAATPSSVSPLENPADAVSRIAKESAPKTIGQHISTPVEPGISTNRNDYYYTAVRDFRGDRLVGSEESPVWFSDHNGPMGIPGTEVVAVRKDSLDPSKLKIAANGYPTYTGEIDPSNALRLGTMDRSSRGTVSFDVEGKLQEAARNATEEFTPLTRYPDAPALTGRESLLPGDSGLPPIEPPNPPVSFAPTPPEPRGRVTRTMEPLTSAVLRGGADIVGASTGAVAGYGDTRDESISPSDRIIGALTGAIIGGTTAHVGGSLVRRVTGNQGVPGAFPLPNEQDVKGITGAIANLTFRGFDKEALRNEERARTFAQKLRAGRFDELPEDAKQLKLNTEEQVAHQIKSIGGEHFDDQALREFMVENAATNHYYEGLRGGRQSAAVQQELANGINKTIDDLISEYNPNKSPNAPEVRFIAGQIVAQHRKVAGIQDQIEQIASLPDTDINKLSAGRMAAGKLVLEMDRLTGLVGIHAAYGSNTARALQARQNLRDAIHTSDDAAINYLYKKFAAGVQAPAPGESLNKAQNYAMERAASAIAQLQDLRANGATSIQLNEFWAAIEKNKVNKEDLFKLFRYNSMLSGPRTVEIALASNALQLMAKAPRDLVATSLAAYRGEANVRELRHEWAGAIQGFHQGSQAAMQVLMHGATDEAFMNSQELTRSLAPRVDPEHWLTKALGVERSKNIIRVMEIPGRLTQMPDELARHIVIGAELHRQAAREAHNIIGPDGARLSGKVWADKVAELVKQPTSAMLKRVEAAGKIETYKGEMGNLGQIVDRNLSKIPYVGNIIAPFYRTSYHITSRGVDFSPLGLGATLLDVGKGRYGPVMDVIRGKIANPEGIEGQLNPVLSRRLHDGLVGTVATTYFASQALQGNISGSGPQDPQKKQMLLAQGWTPYSIRVPNPFDQGKPVWISYANLGPVAIPMALGAAYAEAETYGDKQNGSDFGAHLGEIARRSLSVATEQTYLQSIRSVFDLMNGNSETAGPRFAANLISSLIPFGAAISTIGQTADTKQRRADPGDIMGSVMNRISGATIGDVSIGRASLPGAQDTLGREIPNSLRGAGAFNPIRASSTGGKESQGLELLSEYGVDYPSIPSTWGGKQLNREQQRQLQEMMGTNAEIALRQLRRSLEWQTAVDRESRTAMVKAVLNEARNQAGKRFLDLGPLQDTSLQDEARRNTRQYYTQGRSAIDSLPYSIGGVR